MKTNKIYFTPFFALCVTFIFSFSLSVSAQHNPFETNFKYDELDPRYFDQVQERYQDYFSTGYYDLILKSLLNEFIYENDIWKEVHVRDEKQRFVSALKDFIELYEEIAEGKRSRSDIPNDYFSPDLPNAFGNDYLSYYPDNNSLTIKLVSDSLDTLQAVDLRYRMSTLQRVTDQITEDDRLNIEENLKKLNQQWDNFHFKGKSQYPWEFLVNSLILKKDRPLISPPDWQLVLLHPNLSFELDASDVDALKSYQVFNIEVIGLAWGINNYKDNIAASLIVNLNNNLGNGYGGMLTWNNVQLGAVYHDNTERINAVITMDLFKLIQNSKEQWDSLRD